jgi:hypothetical protein
MFTYAQLKRLILMKQDRVRIGNKWYPKPVEIPPPKGAGYHGMTHSGGRWTKRQCLRGEHQWDEVWSTAGHRLVCDHCQISVFIAKVDYTYDKFKNERVARLRARKKRGYGP